MTKRKFYKTVITVTVLSEEPFSYNSLEEVSEAITDGDCTGSYETTETITLTGKQMVKEVKEVGSSPSFFQLDKNGNDEE